MPTGAHFEPFELVGRYLTNPELLAVNQVRHRPLSGQPDLAVGSHWASAGSNGPRCFQDKWGVQGSLVDMGDGSHIYGKPLSDGSFAVALLNLGIFAFDAPFPIASHYLPSLSRMLPTSVFDGTGASTANVTVAWSTLGPTMKSDTAVVRDVWKRKDLGLHDSSFSAEVLGHGVEIIRVTPK